MLAQAEPEQVPAILGAMLAVAAVRGVERVTDADRASVAAASRYIFRRPAPLDFSRLPSVGPAERGSEIGIDVFDPGWDFWAATREGLDDLRRRYRLSALEPAS